jgi:quinol monooxygenase YgiN
MTKVGVFIKFTAKPGMRDELVEHFRSLVKIANSESGTEDWTFHISPIEPDAVWLYEVYTDQGAKDLHDSTEINAEAKAKTHELTVGAPEVVPFIPIQVRDCHSCQKDNARDHPVAASKFSITKRPIRDLGASHCYA